MTLPPYEHPEAAAELDGAVAWYEARRTGVGLLLVDRARAARRSIADWPDAWPVFPGWGREPVVRMKKVRAFPYHVVYFVREGQVIIAAYAHTSRKPGYWRDRVEG